MLIKFGNAVKLTKAVNPNSTSVDGKLPDEFCQQVFNLPYVLATDRTGSGHTCDAI